MKKRVVIAAVIFALFLTTAVPVLAGPWRPPGEGGAQNACNAGQLHGIFDPDQAPDPVTGIIDTALSPVPGFDTTTVIIIKEDGAWIVIDYDENVIIEAHPAFFPFPVYLGFQCRNLNPSTGVPLPVPADDTIVSIYPLLPQLQPPL